jgi:hypothetical protein
MKIQERLRKELLKIVVDRTKELTESCTGSDRDIAITAVCLMDNLLERTLKKHFIKDNRVKTIFKNEHILQTFHAKAHIAYFSGLIPRFLFEDLLLLGRIRNKFAHELDSKLSFNSPELASLMRGFNMKPKAIKSDFADMKLKYLSIVNAMSTILTWQEFMIIFFKSGGKMKTLQELYSIDDMPFEEVLQSEAQWKSIFSKCETCPKAQFEKLVKSSIAKST